jgi:BatD DUF11 like domain
VRRAVVVSLSMLGLAAVARADAPEFLARLDRAQVALGESFVLEVTLSGEEVRIEDYRPPDLKGMRVLSQQPTQSTQISVTGSRSLVRTIYSWRYDLEPLQKGTLTISPAQVRTGGRAFKTASLTITVTEAAPGSRPAAPARRGGVSPLSGFPFSGEPAAEEGRNFLRVLPSKSRAYVGEQITVEWYLYLTARQDRYQTVTEPRAEGFWSEDLPVPSSQSGLQLSRQMYEGQEFMVAPLLRRALFGLAPGRLTITAMESEISQVDFFGSTMRTQRLKTDPLAIEIQALPTAGQPRGFDPAAVGRFQLAARVDRDHVQVGDAVTLTITISGQGNLRKLPPPILRRLDGWKLYDPKVAVNLESADTVNGTKTVEYLLLPERAGTTVLPAFSLPYFDPSTRSYVIEKTAPLRLEVVGEGMAGGPGARPGAGKHLLAPVPGGAENVLGIDIRPPRVRPTLSRDLGTTFYRSRIFVAVVAAPPLALGLMALMGRVRERLNQDTEGARRRRLRRLVRRRLGAAERHLREGRTGPFFIEIDRVLRDFLSAKLGRPVTGMSRDELSSHLGRVGLPPELVAGIIAALEEGDRARFAPGPVEQAQMRAALDRAGEVILLIERSPLREVGS